MWYADSDGFNKHNRSNIWLSQLPCTVKSQTRQIIILIISKIYINCFFKKIILLLFFPFNSIYSNRRKENFFGISWKTIWNATFYGFRTYKWLTKNKSWTWWSSNRCTYNWRGYWFGTTSWKRRSVGVFEKEWVIYRQIIWNLRKEVFINGVIGKLIKKLFCMQASFFISVLNH